MPQPQGDLGPGGGEIFFSRRFMRSRPDSAGCPRCAEPHIEETHDSSCRSLRSRDVLPSFFGHSPFPAFDLCLRRHRLSYPGSRTSLLGSGKDVGPGGYSGFGEASGLEAQPVPGALRTCAGDSDGLGGRQPSNVVPRPGGDRERPRPGLRDNCGRRRPTRNSYGGPFPSRVSPAFVSSGESGEPTRKVLKLIEGKAAIERWGGRSNWGRKE